MEEKLGYANIAFARRRDAIIHKATRIISYFAENPKLILEQITAGVANWTRHQAHPFPS